jgi:hypothetical protein
MKKGKKRKDRKRERSGPKHREERKLFVLLLLRAAISVAVAAELSANLPRH